MRSLFDSTVCRNLKAALGTEWLETNGVGGYAASTVIGANTRGHHGLLVAPAQAPLHRHVLLAKCEERVLINGHEAYLCTNLYPGTVYPHGFNIMTEFRRLPWPTFRFADAEFEIEKTVCLVHGQNTVVLAYRNLRSSGPLELRIRPLLAYRDHNNLRARSENVDLAVAREGRALVVRPREALPRLYFWGDYENVETKPDWYYRFTYPTEQAQGHLFEEDLFTTFELTYRIPPGETRYLVASTETLLEPDGAELMGLEAERRETLTAQRDPVRQALWPAAEAFLVQRGEGGSVLAGYPWYADWGRVALVALPGLTLARRQPEVAGRVLATFARYLDRGLLPNSFDELTGKPEYNSVDAPLWFILASWRWWQAGADKAAVKALLPALRGILEAYTNGTRFEIGADRDGLLGGGGPGSQLTWMDVKIEGYVPTPRHGKAVEVNALWFNALHMMAELEKQLAGDAAAAQRWRQQADRVGTSFTKVFWNANGGYLHDVLRPEGADDSIRPNQLFAVGLPFSPLDKNQQQAVLAVVTQHLLTPYGLRTLSPLHPKYCRQYAGNYRQRDFARHQGTVWPWLIGIYCDAYARVHGTGKPQRKEILALLQPLLDQLDQNATGSLPELFDGDAPHRPGGCIASSWAVGELLRAYTTYA